MEDLLAFFEGVDGFTALIIVVGVAFLLLKFMIYVLLHYLYSRILSAVCGIAFIVIYFVAIFTGSVGGGLILFPLLWLQYISFIGPSVFDEYWDGTATITIDFDKETMEIKDNYIKNFAIHTAIAIMVGVPFFMWGVEIPFVQIIPCIILLIVTVIGFIRQLFNGDY